MWSPPDPYAPTSELYRLMPPLAGDDPIMLISPDLGRWRTLAARARPASHWAIRWTWRIVAGVVTGVLVTLISAYLLSR